MTFHTRTSAVALALLTPFRATAAEPPPPPPPTMLYAQSVSGETFGVPARGHIWQYSALVKNSDGAILNCNGLRIQFNQARDTPPEVVISSEDNMNLAPALTDALRSADRDRAGDMQFGSCRPSSLGLPPRVTDALAANDIGPYFTYMDGENFYESPTTTRKGDVGIFLLDPVDGPLSPSMTFAFLNDQAIPDEFTRPPKATPFHTEDADKAAKFLATFKQVAGRGRTQYYAHYRLRAKPCGVAGYDPSLQEAADVYVNNHPWGSELPPRRPAPVLKPLAVLDCSMSPPSG